ncbi:LOG family protein [Aureispira anguillae]|uniref:Cytokinin riboside 5'-monophosphate phosphoribohydrolase n=1 Tax=Aureispira anguillae TaxID=2864201 RepID=A0A915VKA1_9BACT|nr:TIGR00730 family Rossman fold protein [Aureispira anguillae]BDS09485.1 TIGR00730 family Rossman fold protein [Aureispira anguillae]
MKVCVYCASSTKVDTAFFEATTLLANELVNEGIEVLYGGGAVGLMGKLADVVLERGGKIKGIMPEFMDKVEWGHKSVTNFEYTKTMHERKAKLIEGVDAVIALAGGSGTLEELLEAITLKRLGLFTKPIIILNTNGYYNPLKEMLERCVNEHFMREEHLEMWSFVDEPEGIIPAIKEAKEWSSGAINFAANH